MAVKAVEVQVLSGALFDAHARGPFRGAGGVRLERGVQNRRFGADRHGTGVWCRLWHVTTT